MQQTYTTYPSVDWSPDFSNLSISDQTGLVKTADFVGDYDASFAEISGKFEEGARITNTISSQVFTNMGTVLVPNFLIDEAVTDNIVDGSITGKKVSSDLLISPAGAGVDASGGATDCTVTGVKAGDKLLFAQDYTLGTIATSKFATHANGTDTISQLNTDLSGSIIQFLF